MARSVDTIHTSMMSRIAGDATLNERLSSTSQTAIYRMLCYVVAIAIWMHEVLFDEHSAEVATRIANERYGGLPWYADMAKRFQYGHPLIQDTDQYATVDTVSQIIKHAKVDEIGGNLFLKVAKDVNGELTYLDGNEMTAFVEYIKQIKVGGVNITIISSTGDDLRMSYDVWYDPLVLDEHGIMLDGSGREPAKETVRAFIKSLPFNGHFIPTKLTDAMQTADGVKIPVLLSAESRNGINDFAVIDGYVVPRAGYLTVTDENLTFNYKPYVRS